jgi:hypothetical protein
MSRPISVLVWMLGFVALVAAVAGALHGPLLQAFEANRWFNGIILGVLLIGIAVNVRQVFSLERERRWIEEYRACQEDQRPQTQPRLLASMARLLLSRRGGTISALGMRSILDALRTRLEESREISRYLIGLLVFLGLLGTFWGLLETVSAVGQIIGNMQVDGGDGAAIFEALKQSLEQPLAGMGVAFSSSLFGLAGSLVLGFLDLQAGHAQNRFVNELEEWLSASARLGSGALSDEGEVAGSAYTQALLEQTADALERLQRMVASGEQQRSLLVEHQDRSLTLFEQLEKQLARQNELLEFSAKQQAELPRLVERLAAQPGIAQFSEEMRGELRLMTRALANSLQQSQALQSDRLRATRDDGKDV